MPRSESTFLNLPSLRPALPAPGRCRRRSLHPCSCSSRTGSDLPSRSQRRRLRAGCGPAAPSRPAGSRSSRPAKRSSRSRSCSATSACSSITLSPALMTEAYSFCHCANRRFTRGSPVGPEGAAGLPETTAPAVGVGLWTGVAGLFEGNVGAAGWGCGGTAVPPQEEAAAARCSGRGRRRCPCRVPAGRARRPWP